ncbi:GLIPR1-like protein 1 [Dama dama]|uniref:GLIPR1-like protein 1 n=1 Tax=Dama dama TaxID=30532 RepID=UPI002A366075|nr:GLIPR1-like protein 1 [Dama dama]
MILRKKLSYLWTLGLCLVASKSPPKVPSITNETFIAECVRFHNEARTNVSPPAANMKYMSWDEALAKTAEAWAKRCKFNHNSCSTQVFKCHPTFQLAGENLWLGPLTASVTKFAVDMWYDERKFYDFNTKSCSKICGHYTQVVWASSFKVGCAVAICPNLGSPDTALFVCNYALVGNYPNVSPYMNGTPCSMCEGDTCENKLCRNKERDKPHRYPGWNPSGTRQLIACNPLYVISVLLTIF